MTTPLMPESHYEAAPPPRRDAFDPDAAEPTDRPHETVGEGTPMVPAYGGGFDRLAPDPGDPTGGPVETVEHTDRPRERVATPAMVPETPQETRYQPSPDAQYETPAEAAADANAAGRPVLPGPRPGAEPLDVVDVLTRDHREVERLFAQMSAPSANPEHRRSVANVVIAELSRHAVAEEQYLYPAARRYLDDGDQIADHEIAEHAQAEQVMRELLKLDADSDGFHQLLSKLISDIHQHVQEEEGTLFPRLRQACDRGTLVDLGTKILAAKQLAPTRPHPAGPDTPPLNKVVGPVMGLVDQAVDALTDRPTTAADLAAQELANERAANERAMDARTAEPDRAQQAYVGAPPPGQTPLPTQPPTAPGTVYRSSARPGSDPTAETGAPGREPVATTDERSAPIEERPADRIGERVNADDDRLAGRRATEDDDRLAGRRATEDDDRLAGRRATEDRVADDG